MYKDFYLSIHERQRERERERGRDIGRGRRGCPRGAQWGTRSRDSRITPQTVGCAKPLCHWGYPIFFFKEKKCLVLEWSTEESLETLMAVVFFFFKDFILFMRDTERERQRHRGRSRLPAGIPVWDLTPGPWDHDLSQRQTLNHWVTQAPLSSNFNYKWNYIW